jgi:hypothetical protein
MKKIDFAIHLFAAARNIGNSHPHRVPVVSLLMLMILSRRPDEWMTGTQLAAAELTLTSTTFCSCTRGAVEAGLLDKRPVKGGLNGALEWKITPAGLRLVEKLMKTEEPATATATP